MNKKRIFNMRSLVAIFTLMILLTALSYSQPGMVMDYQKISDVEGNFTGILNDEDAFNRVENIGDLDKDGITDIAVGAFWDDDGGGDRGAVWILFLNADATVKSFQKISDAQGGFTGTLEDGDVFGYAVESLGDLDGDGNTDIAVGAPFSDEGGISSGAVWILFLQANGTVKAHQKINQYNGNFGGVLDANDFFGIGLGCLGDFDQDGVNDLAVGATGDEDGGGVKTGAVWLLLMNSDGTVKANQKISATQGNFNGGIGADDRFGRSISTLGDLNLDGNGDIIVGSITDNDGGFQRGSLYVLFLNPNMTVQSYQKISDTQGNFTAIIEDDDQLGQASSLLGDIDGDGVMDVVTSAHNDDDGGLNRGAVYILFLNTDGTVKDYQKISDTEGGFTGLLDEGDTFGSELSFLGDINNDGLVELGVGACWDDDGGYNRGAIWILSIEAVPSCTFKLDLKAFLEGPYTGTIMAPVINLLGLLPLSQPYSSSPWFYTGTESVSAIPSLTVVDWVLVELRETTGSASTAIPDSVVARKAGFILADGTIRSIDAVSLLPFQNQVTADLYAVVYHRNHLAVMSSAPLVANGNIYSWNFTTGADQVFGGLLGHKDLGGGVFGLIGGDGDRNGQIQNQDKLEVWKPQAGQIGYLAGDYDLNGQVQNDDKIDIWMPNCGRGSKVPGGY